MIEYFGLSRDPEYRRMMADKRHFWKSKGWTLLEYDPDSLHGDVGSALPIALEEDLVRMGVRLRRRSDEELWEARGRQLRLSISRLISQLIGRCRKASLSPEDLSRRLQKHNPVDPIEADVLGLLSEAYSAYLETLRKNEEEDFEGLLQRSISMVRSGAWEFGRRDLRGDVRRIRHVLVDEFQDVAPLFWELVEAVRGVCAQDAKVFGVGDDWQAINGFAGSSPRFLRDFPSLLQPSAVLGLLTNYRSSCAVIDAGNAIMSGQGAPARPVARAPRGQALLADLGGFEPSVLETHHWRGDRVTPALRRLIAGPVAEGRTVAVLARQRFTPYPMSDRAIGFNNGPVDSPSDLDRLRRLVCEGMDAKSRERVLFDTVHAFKGREADYVVVLDAVEGRFPKVHPDWVFGRVLGDSLESLLEDERRLFYVGCSRAASTLVILTEGSRKCSFLPEIESKFTALRWDFLRPACPRDGDWLMMIDGAEGEGSEPTFQRRDALKARGFSYFGSDAGGVWHLRFPGDMNVAEISAKIPKALWFPGPAGLRIRLMHGDGLVAAEFIVASDQSVDGGLRLAPRYVGR